MAKTQDEQFAAEEAAKQYVSGKQQAASDESFSGIDFDKTQYTTAIIPALSAQDFHASINSLLKRKVASCTLAHTVSIRGTETRTVSAMKLDFKAAGLEILESDRGLEISYSGSDSKRYTLITPWANVVEFRFET